MAKTKHVDVPKTGWKRARDVEAKAAALGLDVRAYTVKANEDVTFSVSLTPGDSPFGAATFRTGQQVPLPDEAGAEMWGYAIACESPELPAPAGAN